MTKTTVKQLGTVAPDYVMEAVKAYATRYHLRNLSFEMKAAGSGLYLDEDASVTFFLPDGTQKSVRMAGEWNMTASAVNGRVSGAVGDKMPMPSGSWAVEFEFFLGHPIVSVYHWGLPALPGGK